MADAKRSIRPSNSGSDVQQDGGFPLGHPPYRINVDRAAPRARFTPRCVTC